jgi:hypothetical protein
MGGGGLLSTKTASKQQIEEIEDSQIKAFFTREYTYVYRRHIMLRDLLTQKSVNQQMVTIFGYPRACRFRKYQFENRSWELPLPTFFKT